MSNPERGTINYVHVYETWHEPNIPHGCLTSDEEGLKTLIAGLDSPSYVHYDYHWQHLYVCDRDKIKFWKIQFTNSADELVQDTEGTILVSGVMCGGMNADKFGNLYFVDKTSGSINRILGGSIERVILGMESEALYAPLYSRATTETANNLEDISIENEYLYWTNSASGGRHGSIHKAFTEPFVRAVPFQTYEDYDVRAAQSIATNNHFLFFTGLEYVEDGFDEEAGIVPRLFVQKKNGASYY